jgi:hypothetical protein
LNLDLQLHHVHAVTRERESCLLSRPVGIR